MSKQFIYEGDTVKLKQQVANSPEMVVEEIEKVRMKVDDAKKMMGVRCYWFCKNSTIQIKRFDFKDLIIVKRAAEYDK